MTLQELKLIKVDLALICQILSTAIALGIGIIQLLRDFRSTTKKLKREAAAITYLLIIAAPIAIYSNLNDAVKENNESSRFTSLKGDNAVLLDSVKHLGTQNDSVKRNLKQLVDNLAPFGIKVKNYRPIVVDKRKYQNVNMRDNNGNITF